MFSVSDLAVTFLSETRPLVFCEAELLMAKIFTLISPYIYPLSSATFLSLIKGAAGLFFLIPDTRFERCEIFSEKFKGSENNP